MTDPAQVYAKALDLLARRDHSRMELRAKLGRFADAALVDQTLQRLESQGLIHEERFGLERALFLRRRKGWGSLRIRQDLTARGLDAKMIACVLERVGEVLSEDEALSRLVDDWIRVRGEPRDRRKLQRIYTYCSRLGHDSESIRRKLQPLFESLQAPLRHEDDHIK